MKKITLEKIQELALLEQNIYANHYDKDIHKGNPRDGWVKVGLIDDLSLFISPECKQASRQLRSTWKLHWNNVSEDQNVTDTLVKEIENVRDATREVLKELY